MVLKLSIHTSASPRQQGSEGDQNCIFFTLNTYQATVVSDILCYDARIGSGMGQNADGNPTGCRQDADRMPMEHQRDANGTPTGRCMDGQS